MENAAYAKEEPDKDLPKENGQQSGEEQKTDGAHEVTIDYKDEKEMVATKPYAGMNKEDLLRFSNTPFWNRFRMVCLVIFWLGWLALLGAVIGLTIVAPRCGEAPSPDWWQRSALYQVYVRSFQDSNGDGIGDIQGLVERLDHLKGLEVEGIIVSSLYPSGAGDLNQEITNHTAIDPDYGTMEDFRQLLNASHHKGLKVILDFIPNHTGREHPWFIESSGDTDGSSPYWNYYVWENCEPSSGTYPNNWRSVYGGPAWGNQTDDNGAVVSRAECYLHQLLPSQPDLNLRSNRVKEELEEILRFWLDLGVDGFRVNSAEILFEDSDLRDDGVIEDCSPAESYECLDHKFTKDQPEIHDLIARWRHILEEYTSSTGTERILLTDADTSLNETLKYYGSLGRVGAHLPINYNLRQLSDAGRTPGRKIHEVVNQWLDLLPEGETANWALGSQDRRRMTFPGGDMKLRALQVLQYSLPGVPITYYGQEIAMKNGNQNSEENPPLNRHDFRSPMQWDSSGHGGFTSGSPWYPVNTDYETVNVQSLANKTEEVNVFTLNRRLAELRREQDSLQFGSYTVVHVTDSVFSFLRQHEGRDRILVCINLSEAEVEDDYASHADVANDGEVVLTTHPNSTLVLGDDKSLKTVKLKPDEAAIFKWSYSR